ncbi:ABC transporter H family member 2-like [Hylaeus anthracinus]|uniref:ABC transporter H family member 2-like n=1 Tax=Hylaeus anthracinus TaxID=313031 RepID=UPI0023B922D5|nr:ABC transporter H family member 2-like [Hylaeus anthracinus]
MAAVCCGCFKTLTDVEQKNIFDETLRIFIDDYIENSNKIDECKKQLKLSESIELIMGIKIVQSNEQSVNLCDNCFQNIQLYINLRTRLLHSLRSLKNGSNSNEPSSKNECTKTSQNQQDNQSIENVDTNKKVVFEDVINVDENSTPLEFNSQLSDQETADTNDSINNVTDLQDDQENNNSSDLENSNTNSSPSMSREIPLKVKDNDIESEIDVCSGDDEEVLELDNQDTRANIVEINTSSESDIEVCDYEPIGKRMKKYHAFSPHLLF